jgi:uncharacterized protein involved in exopolysaccharide biosynthesis
MLLRQYEQARLAEAQEPALIQVIDEAIPPHFKSKPQRKKIVVLATVLGFFLSIFLSFVLEFFSKAAQDEERSEKLNRLKNLLSLRERKA